MMIQAIVIVLVALLAVATCAPTHTGAAMSTILQANKEMDKHDIMQGDVKLHLDRQNALMSKTLRWKDNIMHYTIKANHFSSANENRIRNAMKIISSVTCIEFKEHTNGNTPDDHVEIIDGSGCWSYVGWQGGKQQLSLNSNYCMGLGTTTHEILHALGVDHEQARKDRDEYIRVIWGNVESGQEINFQKEDTDSLGVAYDPISVMQYGNDDWSKNGGDTLEWIADKTLRLGGEELSELDILQLNLYYECLAPPITTTTTTKKSTTTTMKPTTTTTTKKSTTTTTMKPTTTTTTTTTKTPKPATTTTTTRKPTKTTTTTSTEEPTPVPEACGDTAFRCLYAHYYPKEYCHEEFYKTNCHQACKMCGVGDEVQCGNFQETDDFGCYEKAMAGHCTISVYNTRWDMKTNCPKTCCEEGHLYK